MSSNYYDHTERSLRKSVVWQGGGEGADNVDEGAFCCEKVQKLNLKLRNNQQQE